MELRSAVRRWCRDSCGFARGCRICLVPEARGAYGLWLRVVGDGCWSYGVEDTLRPERAVFLSPRTLSAFSYGARWSPLLRCTMFRCRLVGKTRDLVFTTFERGNSLIVLLSDSSLSSTASTTVGNLLSSFSSVLNSFFIFSASSTANPATTISGAGLGFSSHCVTFSSDVSLSSFSLLEPAANRRFISSPIRTVRSSIVSRPSRLLDIEAGTGQGGL